MGTRGMKEAAASFCTGKVQRCDSPLSVLRFSRQVLSPYMPVVSLDTCFQSIACWVCADFLTSLTECEVEKLKLQGTSALEVTVQLDWFQCSPVSLSLTTNKIHLSGSDRCKIIHKQLASA